MKYKQLTEQILKNPKAEKTIIILCVIGMALVFISGYIDFGGKKETSDNKNDTESYKAKLENEISETVSLVSGVGRTKVMITLENGVEYIYVSEENKNVALSEDYVNSDRKRTSQTDNSKQNVIIVDSPGGGKEALIKTEIEPQIKGVLIVCDGGDSEEIKSEIKEILSSLLNISEKKISVSKLST